MIKWRGPSTILRILLWFHGGAAVMIPFDLLICFIDFLCYVLFN
jgi:hypothetical protein